MKAKFLFSSAFAASLGLGQAATVAFLFDNGTELDGSQPAGASMLRTENGETVTLTTIENLAPDFNAADPYAALISSGVDTSVNSPRGLGINNPSINNSNFNTQTGAGGSEGNNLNYLESIRFEFDQPVTIDLIDLASVGSDEFLRITVEGVAMNFDLGDGNAGDIFNDPLSGLVIPAGSDITFIGEGGISTTNLRIDILTVNVVPEPSVALLGLLGGMLCLRRSRK